jgi:hypothetical protein
VRLENFNTEKRLHEFTKMKVTKNEHNEGYYIYVIMQSVPAGNKNKNKDLRRFAVNCGLR